VDKLILDNELNKYLAKTILQLIKLKVSMFSILTVQSTVKSISGGEGPVAIENLKNKLEESKKRVNYWINISKKNISLTLV
jgi:hypothetical protein